MDNKKLIFLDIDGTIYQEFGVIPDSAKNAIRMARENGHLVVINSGRGKYEIPEEIIALGVDGIVGGTGSYVEIDGKVLLQLTIEKELVKEVTDFLTEHNVVYLVSTGGKLYGTKENVEAQRKGFAALGELSEDVKKAADVFLNIIDVNNAPGEMEGVYKILFFQAQGIGISDIRQKFEERLTVIGATVDFMTGESGEIYGKFYNKSTGMQKVMDYYGIDRLDTIAFGDGENDYEMLEYAGIGVAMGNAGDTLKKKADMVTSHVADDGLYNGFKKLGLI